MGRLATIIVPVELPREAVAELDPERVASDLRELWAVEQVRQRRCDVGKGAELAGLPRAASCSSSAVTGSLRSTTRVDDLREELRTLDRR